MSFLTLGGTTIPVRDGGASRKPDQTVGDTSRAFDGSLRSSVTVTKWAWSITTPPLTAADAATVITAAAVGSVVEAGGDAYGGVATNVIATVDEYTPQKWGRVGDAAVRYTVTLTLREV